jgi:hypothetical protein
MVVIGSVPSKLSKPDGPYPKGTSLDGKNVHLKKKYYRLKVMLCNGQKHTIKGPHNGQVKLKLECTSFGQRWLRTITKLFRTDIAGRHKRGRKDSLWMIKVSISATYCIPETVILWRPNRRKSVKLSLAPVNSPTQSVEINWPAKEATLNWPAALELKYNTTYAATMAGKTETFVIKKFEADPSTSHIQQIIRLTDNGCLLQANDLLKRKGWLKEIETWD